MAVHLFCCIIVLSRNIPHKTPTKVKWCFYCQGKMWRMLILTDPTPWSPAVPPPRQIDPILSKHSLHFLHTLLFTRPFSENIEPYKFDENERPTAFLNKIDRVEQNILSASSMHILTWNCTLTSLIHTLYNWYLVFMGSKTQCEFCTSVPC